MKSHNKTQKTGVNIHQFLEAIDHPARKRDAFQLLAVMKDLLPEEPVMWGPSIIGFGDYHYRYESGREGDFFKVGFSPRKQNLTIYIMPGFERYNDMMARLGKYSTGKSCLYIKNLEEVDMDTLKELITASYTYMTSKYG